MLDILPGYKTYAFAFLLIILVGVQGIWQVFDGVFYDQLVKILQGGAIWGLANKIDRAK